MKLLFLFLLLPFAGLGQRDFDYAIYTRYAKVFSIRNQDSTPIELYLERRIVKEANSLKLITLYNTGNAYEFKLSFQGFNWMGRKNGYSFLDNEELEMFFCYTAGDVFKGDYNVIYINPVVPLVIIQKANDTKHYEKYY